MTIPSVLSEVGQVHQAILTEAQEHGFSEHARFAIRLALDEALANAIHHGNCDDPAKHVFIEYTVSDDEVRISVADEGPGFDPNKVPDCTRRRNLMKPSGRGVMLIRTYMTQVEFSPEGNRVTMIKRRDCQLPTAAPQSRT